MNNNIIYKLYGNNILVGKFNTKQECEKMQKELKETEKNMFNNNNIKFKIKEEEKIKLGDKKGVNNNGKK